LKETSKNKSQYSAVGKPHTTGDQYRTQPIFESSRSTFAAAAAAEAAQPLKAKLQLPTQLQANSYAGAPKRNTKMLSHAMLCCAVP
jgi:hypothetical protein